MGLRGEVLTSATASSTCSLLPTQAQESPDASACKHQPCTHLQAQSKLVGGQDARPGR